MRITEPEITTLPLLEVLKSLETDIRRVLLIRSAPQKMMLAALSVLRRWRKELDISVLCHAGEYLPGCVSLEYPDQGFFRLERLDIAALRKIGFDLVLVPYATDCRLSPYYENVDRIAGASGAGEIVIFYRDSTAVRADKKLLELKRREVVEPYRRRKAQALAEICAFTHEDLPDVEEKCEQAGLAACSLWNRNTPSSESELRRFYQDNDFYVYELMKTEYTGSQDKLLEEILGEIRPGRQMLDYGGGCGTLAIASAGAGVKTSYLDLPGVLLDFAAFRFRRRNLPVKVIAAKGKEPLNRLYDAIACIDVLEHLSRPEDTLRLLAEHVRPGGKLILKVDFEENPVKDSPLPLHLNRLSRSRYNSLVGSELLLEHLRSYGELDIFSRLDRQGN